MEKKKLQKQKKRKKIINKKAASKEKDIKDKKEALYDEKGERIIGSLDITCFLKRPYKKYSKIIIN